MRSVEHHNLLTLDGASADWTALADDASLPQACGAWLDRLVSDAPQARRCLVLWRSEGESLQLAGIRPTEAQATDLLPKLNEAAALDRAACMALDHGALLVAPVRWANATCGLLALELSEPHSSDRALVERLQRQLNWGSGWMMALAAQRAQQRDKAALGEARKLLQLMAVAAAEPGFSAASQALTDRMAVLWQAESAMLGWVKGMSADVVARANASQSDERANLLILARAAMDEALDLRRTVQYSRRDEAGFDGVNLPEHRAYAREVGCEVVVTALLFDQGVAVGAMLLERRLPLAAEQAEVLDTQCMMLAPLLAQRHDADRSLWQHLCASARRLLRRGGDDSLLGWKALAGIAALALLLAAVLPVDFRITAASVVEGEVRRTIAAPFEGYVSEAHFRAGDLVRSGQVLATLDDRDLRLERDRWRAELELAQRKEREAMAAANRVDLRLASAQASQAAAQLALAEEKLKRVQLLAPFDGVVVRGDLSQQLGTPVEQGKPLFEIAPMDAWRVILKVDERDVVHVQPGQTGELVLAGLSGQRHAFVVKRITAVAVAEEGRNHFRVEAQVADPDTVKLRPGMEGVAKVEAGRESALWVATRRLRSWWRLTLWEWSL